MAEIDRRGFFGLAGASVLASATFPTREASAQEGSKTSESTNTTPELDGAFKEGVLVGRALGRIEALLPFLEPDLKKIDTKAHKLLSGDLLQGWEETKAKIELNIKEAKSALNGNSPEAPIVALQVNDSMHHLKTWALIINDKEKGPGQAGVVPQQQSTPFLPQQQALPNSFIPQNGPVFLFSDYPSFVVFNDMYPIIRPFAMQALTHFFPQDGSAPRGFPPISEEQRQKNQDWRKNYREQMMREAPKWRDIRGPRKPGDK